MKTLQQKVEIYARANGWDPEKVLRFAKERGTKAERMLNPNDEDNLYISNEDIIKLRKMHEH